MQHARRARIVCGADARGKRGHEVRSCGVIGCSLRQVLEPLVDGGVLRDPQERARERGRKRLAEELARVEQLADVLARRVAHHARVVLEQSCGRAMWWTCEESRRELEWRRARCFGGREAELLLRPSANAAARHDR